MRQKPHKYFATAETRATPTGFRGELWKSKPVFQQAPLLLPQPREEEVPREEQRRAQPQCPLKTSEEPQLQRRAGPGQAACTRALLPDGVQVMRFWVQRVDQDSQEAGPVAKAVAWVLDELGGLGKLLLVLRVLLVRSHGVEGVQCLHRQEAKQRNGT